MAVKTKQKDNPDTSTTRHLPFSQIRENIVIMKDDSARLVLKCSTINFLLKNTDEQDSIIISFQRFLNSLDFPIQILVRSRKLDIDSYLAKLNDKAIKQENSLLQNQTYEYIEYLRKLIEVAQIMKKEFYIIIPYDENENKSVKDDSIMGPLKNFVDSVFKNGVDAIKIKSQIRNFTKMKKGLVGRSNSIKTGLENIGIRANTIDKADLVKFLTDYYNPTLSNFVAMKQDTDDYNLLP
ncbi:hypothetical protein A9Q91_05710 [Candidatus Gracilibacteria bacterium 28_42_T64]|nr:hypothetical protein A9Q91_05710 [Candidatus Gracilibacteria bacterium 28_42_T64]